MVTQKHNLFRKESLERLSSPERLDQLMQVVGPKNWIPVITLGCLVGGTAIWSIYGSIPITVEGQGVIIYPRQVVSLQSKGSGQLLALNIKVGDTVKKGQVLATINQAELHKQLQQQRSKLAELQVQDRAIESLEGRRTIQETEAKMQQRQYLQQRIRELQTLTPRLKTTANNSAQQKRQSLQQRLQALRERIPILQERLNIRRQLLQEGAVAADLPFEAELKYQDNLDLIHDLEAELKELDAKEAEQEKAYRDNLSAMADFQSQLKQLDSQAASQAEQTLQAATTRQKEIQEVQREIAKLQLQLRDNSQILSPYSGRILEMAVAPGQVVSAGTRLGAIEAESSAQKLVAVTYFPIAEGKKIQPGLTIQITPQTVKRQRFGGILGKVTAVSSFPITKEAAASEIGNPEIINNLTGNRQEGLIQVFANLKADTKTFSGYQWSSSQGPQLKISSGTTTTVRVKLEDRAPITFVLPLLREYSGIY